MRNTYEHQSIRRQDPNNYSDTEVQKYAKSLFRPQVYLGQAAEGRVESSDVKDKFDDQKKLQVSADKKKVSLYDICRAANLRTKRSAASSSLYLCSLYYVP